MDKTTITVGSVTNAMKVKRLLQKKKIQSNVVKLDSSKTQNGCTHGIEFLSRDFYAVVMELRNSGIEYTVYYG